MIVLEIKGISCCWSWSFRVQLFSTRCCRYACTYACLCVSPCQIDVHRLWLC